MSQDLMITIYPLIHTDEICIDHLFFCIIYTLARNEELTVISSVIGH